MINHLLLYFLLFLTGLYLDLKDNYNTNYWGM